MEFWRAYRQYVVLGMLALVTLGIWAAVFAEERSGVLTVAVLDVGQGDSIFIESPTGVQIIVDGGPDASLLRELPGVMGSFDRSVDAIIETHPDADHIAGFVDLLDRYEVGAFLEPGIPKETLTFEVLQQKVGKHEIPHLLARRGMRLLIGGGAELEVLYPDTDVSELSSSKANEGGIVMKLTYGEATMLLMADVSSKIETYLVGLDGETLDTDLLKVGHHGSRTSTSDAFVKAVTPAAAVISVGGDNTYGHPTSDVINTLISNNVPVLRTDQEGTIVFVSNGGEFVRTK
ncbi:MAG: MBL fold metallo-hydrolase [Patescibacteria group bacterium]|nr:MBL fold metallo-hydrolase [Patescibacteria group bacterium]